MVLYRLQTLNFASFPLPTISTNTSFGIYSEAECKTFKPLPCRRSVFFACLALCADELAIVLFCKYVHISKIMCCCAFKTQYFRCVQIICIFYKSVCTKIIMFFSLFSKHSVMRPSIDLGRSAPASF